MERYGFSKDDIVTNLQELGVERGNVLLVHSSLSRIGYVPGGAETVIDALLEAVGQNGTVAVPTITGQIFDSPENPPSFAKEKPGWTGIIPETLRKRKEAYRSKHPTHSVAAIGNLAQQLTQGHEDILSPCGKGTPYVKIADLSGKILFLGAALESNTTFHSVEELARLYYHLQPEPCLCRIEINGSEVERKMFLHAYGTPRTFGEKEKDLVDAGIARVGYVGRARSVLVDASKMMEFALQKLEKDRLYLIDKESVDLWSISRSIQLVSEGKFGSIKIDLYLPRGALLKFFENVIEVKGVNMNTFGYLAFDRGVLRSKVKVTKSVRLSGGRNYWLEFRKKGKRIEVNIVDSDRPESFAQMNP